MKKMVLKLCMEDEKRKKRVIKAIAGIQGVDSVAVDTTENMITVEGDADPVCVTDKLRKIGYTELLSFGPAKEEEENEPNEDKPNADNQPNEENPSAEIDIPAPQIYYCYCDYVPNENTNLCSIL
ncbi:hypothetical protein SUGI_0123630 [Cryptomeria japonica]|uniref:heavy metal-associated isoprenylated plant protein 39-like n=1 Tax=Cryptomeria japonica TaxID=3369 RepID=UPI0024089636|nr:heavy metal-associated isoprenylated plant protein 39-like [Cryptomeria japonica]GLJ10185.1 hypothetical protein SUGI_0123630 [Cryptomeria japonica]